MPELVHRTAETCSESGVAKTTIYRRFANRAELLRAVLAEAIGTPDPPPEGDVRANLRWALQETWRQMTDVLGPGGVLVVWSAAAAPDLLAAMRVVFGAVEEQAHDVLLQDRPEQYFLYLARR